MVKTNNIVGQGLAHAVWYGILPMAKNNNIVGQGLAPAVRCGILPMAKRANTVRPYGWVFYH